MTGRGLTLGVLGGGAFSLQVIDLAMDIGRYRKFRIYDDFAQIDGERIFGKILDAEADLKRGICDEIVVALGYRHFDFKEHVFKSFEAIDRFARLVHPTSYISRTASIERGVMVFPQVNIDTNARMLEGSIALSKCSITHDAVIGRFSFLSIGVALGGRVVIGDRVFVGINATVVPDVVVGQDSLVGAATLLSDSVPDGSKVVGNPYRYVKGLRV